MLFSQVPIARNCAPSRSSFLEQLALRIVVGADHHKPRMHGSEGAISFDFAPNHRKCGLDVFVVGEDRVVRDRGCSLFVGQHVQALGNLRTLLMIKLQECQGSGRNQRQLAEPPI